ncbi:hypothetical protein AC578_2717 [Pseudocercospora eumusae]|uniref:Uncharacterized protein n=1 Tax=Pseudocercospora eumusae TaxID=321146 RepID=A0A139HG40_9PEZI|nr:hypothetical protein AC578_2717 [Pseudocercospora eumusae]
MEVAGLEGPKSKLAQKYDNKADLCILPSSCGGNNTLCKLIMTRRFRPRYFRGKKVYDTQHWLGVLGDQLERIDQLTGAAGVRTIFSEDVATELLKGQRLRGEFYGAMEKEEKTDVSFPIDAIAMDDITLCRDAAITNPFTTARLMQCRIAVHVELWKAMKTGREPYPRIEEVKVEVREKLESLVAGFKKDHEEGSQALEEREIEQKVTVMMAAAETDGQEGIDGFRFMAEMEAQRRMQNRSRLS